MPAGAVTADAVAVPAPPAWYGKVSMLGDFAHRRLAPGVVQRLDAWLSGWIVDSRARLGDRWLTAYLSAPVLRFVWAPGVIGPVWWFGVLMPSCDRSGRYFPLLVADARRAPPSGRPACPPTDAWFDRIAAVATGTLDDAASLEAFEQALADVPAWPEPAEGAAPARPAPGASQWWAVDAAGIDGPTTVLAGLPEAADLTRLLLAGTSADLPCR